MEPTAPPTDRPVAPARWADPAVDYARTHRSTVGYALVAVGVLLLVLAGVLAYRGELFGGPKPEPDAPLSAGKPARLDSGDFVWGVAWSVVAALPPLLVGVWFLAGVPLPDPAAERTRTRVAILAAVGGLGLNLMLAGLMFFVRWSDRLMKWLDGTGGVAALQWPVFALLALVVGAGLVVLAVQPARAEERNNPALRRLVYGSNLVLTALLLVAVLLAGNVVASQKVPFRLDTTETGFYSISPQTEAFLQQLDRPVTAYAIMLPEGQSADDREAEDTRVLLRECQSRSNGKFKAQFIGSLGRDEYNRLKAKYPEVELYRSGVLVTAGDDGGGKHGFIRYDELSTREGGGRGGEPRKQFVGEARLLRELKFVAEGGGKPVVYFTQSSGELALGDGPGGKAPAARRSAKQLKAYLEKNNTEVRPLRFDVTDPKVPDDAAVVVVADPESPLGDGPVAAVRRYMTDARADGKKGKLLVLAGAHPGADRKPLKLGLEPLLREYNVDLPDRFFLSAETQTQPPTVVTAVPTATDEGGRSPISAGLKRSLPLIDCREVEPLDANPAVRASLALVSEPGRPTWEEPEFPDDPFKAFDAIRANRALAARRGLTRDPRGLAVSASEGQTARAAVFGSGWFASDDATEKSAQATRGTTLWMDLIGGTLDWLRDRPTVSGVASKAYTTYSLPPDVDWTRLLWLPVGLMLLAVVGVGTGVWVVRRS